MGQKYLICNSADTIPIVASVERVCGGCGVPVWVSHTVAGTVDRGDLVPMCPACTGLAVAPGATFGVLSEQTDELARLGLLGLADQVTTMLNRRYGPHCH